MAPCRSISNLAIRPFVCNFGLILASKSDMADPRHCFVSIRAIFHIHVTSGPFAEGDTDHQEEIVQKQAKKMRISHYEKTGTATRGVRVLRT